MILVTTTCACCGLTRHDYGSSALLLDGWTTISQSHYCPARRCRQAARALRVERPLGDARAQQRRWRRAS